MELDDLKTAWNDIGQRLERMDGARTLSLHEARSGTLDRTRSKLRFVRLVLWYEIAAGVVAALLVGSYLAEHARTMRFAGPAAVLHLCAILTIAVAVRQLVGLAGIDYGGPVVAIQRRLGELRLLRARANRWLLISSPLLWALLVIVVPHGLFGLDVYRAFGLPWVAGNLALGIAVVTAAAGLARRSPAWLRDSAFLRWLGDDLTGRRIAAASCALDEITSFEAEN